MLCVFTQLRKTPLANVPVLPGVSQRRKYIPGGAGRPGQGSSEGRSRTLTGLNVCVQNKMFLNLLL